MRPGLAVLMASICAACVAPMPGCKRDAPAGEVATPPTAPSPAPIIQFHGGVPEAEDAELLTGLLNTHVRDGKVDYQAIRHDARLWRYLRRLAEINPNAITSGQDRLALLLNAYNCFVIEGVVVNWPIQSVKDVPDFFSSRSHTLGGVEISLDEVEGLIRAMGDPRVHCAICRGAKDCPTLRQEAYVGQKLHGQLEADCLEVINDHRWVRADVQKGKLYLSQLFRGYLEDLSGKVPDPEQALLDFIYDRLNAPRERDVLVTGDCRIEYMSTDWSLNLGVFVATPTPTAEGSGQHATP